MKKVTITVNSFKAVMKDGQPVLDVTQDTTSYVVASTKSRNNLVESIKEQNSQLGTTLKVVEEDIFVNFDDVYKAIEGAVALSVKDTELIFPIVQHCMSALDGACVFEREKNR